MNTAKKVFLALMFATTVAFSAFAQDAVAKAISSANSNLLVKDYAKAYPYATFLIRFYNGKEMTPEALDVCERVVSAWTSELRLNGEDGKLAALEQSLATAPPSVRAKAADNIAWAKKSLEQKEAEKKKAEEEQRLVEAEKQRQAEIQQALQIEKDREQQREAERQKERDDYAKKEAELKAERERLAADQQAAIDKIIRENRELEARKEEQRTQERLASQQLQVELESQRLDSDQKLREELASIVEKSNQSGEAALRSVSQTSFTVVIGLAVLGFFMLAGIVLVVVMNLRQQAIQHEQFQNTMATMANMRSAQQDLSSMALPFIAQSVAALPQSQPQMIGQSAPQAALPPGQSAAGTMNTPDELKALYDKCLVYADQIDAVTNRKNASRRVAELVYKIAKASGYTEHDALLYYTVGLIYDIGFLNIDPVILRADHISEEQFETIKTHTTIGTNMVFFIEEKNRKLFKDGVSMHHENLDGTGYPHGSKGDEIPWIARAIRIAETYIALVSSRDYKDIKDRDSALKELHEHGNHYDLGIVAILDGIV
jgi:HD-GYP domain-containing protein (c-di-GMP phosphodiesterase class II)